MMRWWWFVVRPMLVIGLLIFGPSLLGRPGGGWGLAVMPAAAEQPVLTLTHGQGPLVLSGHMALLRDPQHRIDLADAVQAAADFRPIAGTLGLGLTPDAAWVRLRLARPADDHPERDPESWVLGLEPPLLQHLDVYLATTDHPRTAEDFTLLRLGSTRPYAERPIPYGAFLIPINLPAGATRDVYIHITTKTSLILFGAVYDQATLTVELVKRSLWYGVVLGAFLLAAFFNLICFTWLRDRAYLFYTAYIIGVLLGHLTIAGTLQTLLPPILLPDSLFWLMLAGILSGSAADLFTRRVLQLRQRLPWIAYGLTFTATIRPWAFVLALLVDYQTGSMVIQFLGLASLIMFLTAAVVQAWRGDVVGRRFLFAFLPAILGAWVLILRSLGVIPTSWLTEQIYFAACLFHVVLISMAMMIRIRDAEQAKYQAQADALMAAHKADLKARRIIREQTETITLAKHEVENALAAERQAIHDQLQFIDMIAHEYRTPIAVLRASLDVMGLRASSGGTTPPTDLIDRMRRAIDRLVELVEVGLRRDQIDQPGLTLNRQPLDLGAIAAQAIGELVDGQALMDLSAPVPVPVSGDAALLRVAVFNLIDNARKYGPKGQAVSVTAGIEDGHGVLRVRDQGPGIAPEARRRIFDKYVRMPASRAVPGVGLGLYLARKIMVLHGGQLGLESEIGAGCTFYLRLPLVMPADSASNHEIAQAVQLFKFDGTEKVNFNSL